MRKLFAWVRLQIWPALAACFLGLWWALGVVADVRDRIELLQEILPSMNEFWRFIELLTLVEAPIYWRVVVSLLTIAVIFLLFVRQSQSEAKAANERIEPTIDVESAPEPEPEPEPEPKSPRSTYTPKHDVWLKDVVSYIYTRDWDGPMWAEPGEGHEEKMGDMHRAAKELRQLAADGEITIWGRNMGMQAQPFFEIPADYWQKYALDPLSMFHDDPELWETNPDIFGVKGHKYWGLKATKTEVEAIWPPSDTH